MCEFAYYPPRDEGEPVPLYTWFAEHTLRPATKQSRRAHRTAPGAIFANR